MKLVIQRVKSASVHVADELCARIDRGLLVFLGIHKDDHQTAIPSLVTKLINLRIFDQDRSLLDVNGELLVVSQFTLYADCSKGRRPFYGNAAPAKVAEPLYENFVAEATKQVASVATGRFGADMQITLVNDGPVTVILEN